MFLKKLIYIFKVNLNFSFKDIKVNFYTIQLEFNKFSIQFLLKL